MLPEAEASSQVDWTYDPNEPRYCICNQVTRHRPLPPPPPLAPPPPPMLQLQLTVLCVLLQVSYGEMVGCDNTDVSSHLFTRCLTLHPASSLCWMLHCHYAVTNVLTK